MRTEKKTIQLDAEISEHGRRLVEDYLYETLRQKLVDLFEEMIKATALEPRPDHSPWTRTDIYPHYNLAVFYYGSPYQEFRYMDLIDDNRIVTRQGKIVKRIANKIHKDLQLKLTAKEKEELGNIVYLNTVHGEYTVSLQDGSFIEKMKRGIWGDPNACFHNGGCYENMRHAIADHPGQMSVFLIRSGGMQGEKIGRCWVFNGERNGQKYYIPFNVYGSSLTTAKIAPLLAQLLDLDYGLCENVRLYRNCSRGLYVNDANLNCASWVIAENMDDLKYANIDLDFTFLHSGDYGVSEECGEHCYICEERIDPDHAQYVNGEYYCEYCYSETFSYCESCCEESYTEDGHWVSDEFYCDHCYRSEIGQCDRCHDDYRNEDLTENDYGSYCEDCYGDLFGQCDHCYGEFSNDGLYWDRLDGEYYCEDCLHRIKSRREVDLQSAEAKENMDQGVGQLQLNLEGI